MNSFEMEIINQARSTIVNEIAALQAMCERLNESITIAVNIILESSGRVVVIGMGKSGIIGQKIAATLASTGTAAFFVHPGEAFHGDLGMIKSIDVALLISNSGETEEVLRILPFLQYQKNKLIAMTGNMHSTLAQHADIILDVGVAREACANNLAPTSSTTCTLVMGDALAVALSVERKFQPADFARFHPGGNLGRKLLTRVADVMTKDALPLCKPSDSFRDLISIINRGRLGLALVMNKALLVGIITDGDVRRAFDRDVDYRNITAAEIMTKSPRTVASDVRFVDAEATMREAKVSALVVIDTEGCVIGVLQIYDLATNTPPK